MTDLSIKNRDQKERQRDNARKNKIEEQKDATTRRGQNVKWASDMYGHTMKGLSALSAIAGGNHPAWYNASKALTDRVSGLSLDVVTGTFDEVGDGIVTVPQHGALSIFYTPVIGAYRTGAVPGNNPADVAAYRLATDIWNNIGRTSSYDAQDLFQVLICIASVYANVAELTRIYGLLNKFSEVNRYLPLDVMKACGYTLDITEKSNLYGAISQLISGAKSLILPKAFHLVERWMFLNSRVFTDHDTESGQFYVYRPTCYYIYDEIHSRAKCVNIYSTIESKILPIEDALNLVTRTQTAIDYLIHSGSVNKMMSDLRHYYQAEVFNLPDLDPNFILATEYNEEVLLQLQNTVLVGAPDFTERVLYELDASVNTGTTISEGARIPDWSAYDIIDNNGAISQGYLMLGNAELPTASDSYPFACGGLPIKLMVNRDQVPCNGALFSAQPVLSDKPELSKDETLVTTRNISAIASYEDAKDNTYELGHYNTGTEPTDFHRMNFTSNQFVVISSGSEIFNYAVLIRMSPDSQSILVAANTSWGPISGVEVSSQIQHSTAAAASQFVEMLQFDWVFPYYRFLDWGYGGEGNSCNLQLIADFKYSGRLSVTQLHNIHYACLFSEFGAF